MGINTLESSVGVGLARFKLGVDSPKVANSPITAIPGIVVPSTSQVLILAVLPSDSLTGMLAIILVSAASCIIRHATKYYCYSLPIKSLSLAQ